MTASTREFDIVVWGATGFTGRLVAQYLLGRYGSAGELRWALGGRNQGRLESVREEIARETGADASALPLVMGDSGDAASVASLAQRTRVVCTTVGPYAKYGSELVAACAAAGTHYCDLTGEVHWMRRMIDAHQAAARASGARIVPTCGFDSIPSDLGTFFVQGEMRARHGVPARRVHCRVQGFRGGISGGTIASMLNLMEEAARDASVRKLIGDPYGLNPEGQRGGADGPDRLAPAWDEVFGQWTAPFVMAGVNTRVVRRSAALLQGLYGDDFRYDESLLTGPGPGGWARAAATAAAMGGAMAALGIGPLRRLIAPRLPAPGQGPSKQRRESGSWDLRFYGEHPVDRGKGLRARVAGDRDPGYGSTSRMLGEAAACLARDELPVGGGFWTPAAAMGEPLLARLQANAGLDFRIEEA